jgi:opacity protein-like surface antigen
MLGSRHLLCLGALTLPVAALAQPVQGLYVEVGGGANIVGDLLSANETTKVETNIGGLGLVDIGCGFGNGLRAEIEGSYRSNGISGISTLRQNGNLLPLSNATGSVRTFAVMANVKYDLPFHTPALPIQPYVGGGAGYGWLDLGNASGNGVGRFALPQGNSFTGPTLVDFGSGGAFAYQAIAGASMPLRVLPGLSLTLEYRFFGTARVDVPVGRTAANTTNFVNGAVPSAATHNGFTEQNNAILIGLLYTFGPR